MRTRPRKPNFSARSSAYRLLVYADIGRRAANTGQPIELAEGVQYDKCIGGGAVSAPVAGCEKRLRLVRNGADLDVYIGTRHS